MNKFNFFKDKKVIITGHTGFKGSWLTLFLKIMGANILGISFSYPTSPLHFKVCKELKNIKSKKIDIRNFNKLKNTISNFKPDYIFHLAAQPIVSDSVKNPLKTWSSNTIGTINILEILKNYNNRVYVVIITSDKVYYNFEKKGAYKETDILGGKDPYSASKASAEIAIKSYFETYLKAKKNINLAVARAGNVIGGGDWSEGRLIPDCVRAWSKKNTVKIRSPLSTRPWQHVMEVVYGYILLALKLRRNKSINGEAFNFGPSSNKDYRVIDCLKKIKIFWPSIKWKKSNSKVFKEAGLLKLNSKKTLKILKWKTILNFNETIKLTAQWYKSFYSKKSEIITTSQIQNYLKKIEKN